MPIMKVNENGDKGVNVMKKCLLRFVPLLFVVVTLILMAVPIASSVPEASVSYPEAPTLWPAGGTYTGFKTVVFHPGTLEVIGYYTTDGTDPRTSNTRIKAEYEARIRIGSSATLKAVYYNENFPEFGTEYSPVTTAEFIIAPFPAPKLEPVAGINIYVKPVVIANTPYDCLAYYTVDGTDPKISSTALLYNGAAIRTDSSKTIRSAFVEMDYDHSWNPDTLLNVGWGPETKYAWSNAFPNILYSRP